LAEFPREAQVRLWTDARRTRRDPLDHSLSPGLDPPAPSERRSARRARRSPQPAALPLPGEPEHVAGFFRGHRSGDGRVRAKGEFFPLAADDAAWLAEELRRLDIDGDILPGCMLVASVLIENALEDPSQPIRLTHREAAQLSTSHSRPAGTNTPPRGCGAHSSNGSMRTNFAPPSRCSPGSGGPTWKG
jgi:hypothetical protein